VVYSLVRANGDSRAFDKEWCCEEENHGFVYSVFSNWPDTSALNGPAEVHCYNGISLLYIINSILQNTVNKRFISSITLQRCLEKFEIEHCQ